MWSLSDHLKNNVIIRYHYQIAFCSLCKRLTSRMRVILSCSSNSFVDSKIYFVFWAAGGSGASYASKVFLVNARKRNTCSEVKGLVWVLRYHTLGGIVCTKCFTSCTKPSSCYSWQKSCGHSVHTHSNFTATLHNWLKSCGFKPGM